MGLKEQVDSDISAIFLNNGEFAETYAVKMGDKTAEVVGVFDMDSESEPIGNPTDGIYFANMRFHCAEKDLPRLPVVGKMISINGAEYMITNISYEMGMVVMTLGAYEAY
jgi:hypothetical protein